MKFSLKAKGKLVDLSESSFHKQLHYSVDKLYWEYEINKLFGRIDLVNFINLEKEKRKEHLDFREHRLNIHHARGVSL